MKPKLLWQGVDYRAVLTTERFRSQFEIPAEEPGCYVVFERRQCDALGGDTWSYVPVVPAGLDIPQGLVDITVGVVSELLRSAAAKEPR